MRCYDCGSRVPPGELLCRQCGGGDITAGMVRPTRAIETDRGTWMWPWTLAPIPPGTCALLAGAKGLGKSSLAALASPTLWFTNEMEPVHVGAMLRRLGVEVPHVEVIEGVDHLRAALDAAPQGSRIVLDSLAELGCGHDGVVDALRHMRSWAQRSGGLIVAINQITKDGTGQGREALEHVVDQVAYIRADDAGRRRFDVVKNRHGRLVSALIAFGQDGHLDRPQLRGAYSVEGTPGAYRLVPVPTKGAEWADPFKLASPPFEGTASAGRRAKLYASGWLLPDDVDERRRFALDHGLRWIDPLTLNLEADHE